MTDKLEHQIIELTSKIDTLSLIYEEELKELKAERQKMKDVYEQERQDDKKIIEKLLQENKDFKTLLKNDDADKEELSNFRKQTLQSLDDISKNVGSSDFSEIESKLNTIAVNTESVREKDDVQHLANLGILFSLFFVIPLLLWYKFLNNWFNDFVA